MNANENKGEHGVGLVKRDYLPHELGETTVDTMRQVRCMTYELLDTLLTVMNRSRWLWILCVCSTLTRWCAYRSPRREMRLRSGRAGTFSVIVFIDCTLLRDERVWKFNLLHSSRLISNRIAIRHAKPPAKAVL